LRNDLTNRLPLTLSLLSDSVSFSRIYRSCFQIQQFKDNKLNSHEIFYLVFLKAELEWDEAMLVQAFDGQIDYTSPGLHFSTAVQVHRLH
jgi:hypothetical protein